MNKFKKFINWIKKNSSTKAAWFTAIAACVALLINSYVLFQNSITLSVSKTALELSMEPSVDFQLYPGGAYVINTSNQMLQDIFIFNIVYVFNPETSEIVQRLQPSGNFRVKSEFKPKEKYEIKERLLVSIRDGIYSLDNPNVYRVVIVTYRRTADLKIFKAMYIFKTFTVNGQLNLVGLGSGQINSGWSGPPQRYLKIIQKIDEIEKVMFKTEKFQ
jgi:hypothetical protein